MVFAQTAESIEPTFSCKLEGDEVACIILREAMIDAGMPEPTFLPRQRGELGQSNRPVAVIGSHYFVVHRITCDDEWKGCRRFGIHRSYAVAQRTAGVIAVFLSMGNSVTLFVIPAQRFLDMTPDKHGDVLLRIPIPVTDEFMEHMNMGGLRYLQSLLAQ